MNLFPGIAARETAQALKILAQAARGVAASTMDPKAAAAMLDSARDVMEGSALLIHEAKQALMSDGDAESQQRLAQVRGFGFYSRILFYLFIFFNCIFQENYATQYLRNEYFEFVRIFRILIWFCFADCFFFLC